MEQDMQNEKAGSNNWKDKLDNTEGLSSFLLQDKNAAWEKLHGRLHEKPAKKKAGWFWLAAACIIGLISIPFMLMNKKQDAITAINPNKEQPAAPGKALPVETTVAVQVEDEIKKTLIVSPVKTIRQAPGAKKLPLVKAQHIAIIEKDTAALASATVQIHPIDTPLTAPLTATTTPEKKKLKVVHVNELGTPLPTLRSRMADDDYSVIQINLFNQHQFNIPPTVPNNVGVKSSKPKNISN